MNKYGKLIIEGATGSSLFDTIKNAKEDFGNTSISNVTVSFNNSLMVPVKTLGVVVDFPEAIWEDIFNIGSAEENKTTVEQINKKIADYAQQYAIDNDVLGVEKEETTGKAL